MGIFKKFLEKIKCKFSCYIEINDDDQHFNKVKNELVDNYNLKNEDIKRIYSIIRKKKKVIDFVEFLE